MDAAELRVKFLDFFASKDHTIVDSAPLVPGNDPTLLFTNSGMVQFKEAFAFREERGYTHEPRHANVASVRVASTTTWTTLVIQRAITRFSKC